ncbi:hypothetical protein BZA05DRAFT_35631 [Tricharina praecox]|uniref:uncharacterized protein n=1 Tax=Tricharina praecox TaxID=43433 RepID=UPI0022206F39|nr:uncharacterized protein BZA05DRAFT_229946 [Tricharina praecox]XP_051339602.1 uncharacterized protein BZA05DRAFT_35631 [Tricharina praecox]KAI5841245.1 hypothetical protein BZA05DRAFT_229946 [Tricharina praecox]KAI5852112.1 hypothetical protein BZA05DRAFT_35631 [Tricharina praecox]
MLPESSVSRPGPSRSSSALSPVVLTRGPGQTRWFSSERERGKVEQAGTTWYVPCPDERLPFAHTHTRASIGIGVLLLLLLQPSVRYGTGTLVKDLVSSAKQPPSFMSDESCVEPCAFRRRRFEAVIGRVVSMVGFILSGIRLGSRFLLCTAVLHTQIDMTIHSSVSRCGTLESSRFSRRELS